MMSWRPWAHGPPRIAAAVAEWFCPTDGSPVVDIRELSDGMRGMLDGRELFGYRMIQHSHWTGSAASSCSAALDSLPPTLSRI